MKFTDGCWMLRDGVTGYFAAEAYQVDTHSDGFTAFAPTRPIRHRGDTLEGPTVTVRFSMPMLDVIRVTSQHYRGDDSQGPHFVVACDDNVRPKVCVCDEQADMTSGRLTLRIANLKSWQFEFSAFGERLTGSKNRSLGILDDRDSGRHMCEHLSLGVGENIYGLGERFTPFLKNGQVVDTWNKDGGTNSEQSYKNVPFYMSSKGYGVFVNHPENVSFEIGSEKIDRVQFSVPGENLDYYVIYGPTPKEILTKYTALTGRPALPPAWSFGLWLTTSFTTNYDEATVTSFVQGMEERNLPLRVFHFDCFWMREFHWCDFEWDRRVFPDPVGMLRRLKERDLKICVWINPYVSQHSKLFDEGVAGGYFIKRTNGEVWQTDQWQPGMAIVDFTNPDARVWYCEKLRTLLAMGVDAFKTDFGERIPTDVVYADGSSPERMHNYYSYLYNKTVFDLLKEEKGEDEAVVFARSGTAGSQTMPVHWGGDCESTFDAMAASLRGGLSLGLSGFGFWSHDIGGFEGTPPEDLYKRWVAFGLLSSHSRLHGSGSYRVPWVYGDEAVNVLRFFTTLKHRLMPYLYSAALEARDFGIPMMRAMLIEFPEDHCARYVDTQYMLGPSLLVAPVLSSSNRVEFYVPEGEWTNMLSGTVVTGPAWRTETHGFSSLPLLVRPHSIVAVGNREDRPDYDYTDDVTFEIYALNEGVECVSSVPSTDGKIKLTVTAMLRSKTVTVNVVGAVGRWRVLMVGCNNGDEIPSGKANVTHRGLLVDAPAGQTSLIIPLG